MTAGTNLTSAPSGQLCIEGFREIPPVFTGFELYANDENGFFIINSQDGSIFKWIDVESLEENGVYYGEKKMSKGGRRNFEGTVFNCFERPMGKGYFETNDRAFKECIANFGGFYMAICKARNAPKGKMHVFCMPDHAPLGMISHYEAVERARDYYKKYAAFKDKEREFKSSVPCGAAYDCMYEEIFERFKEEVMAHQMPNESTYEAWNRYDETVRKSMFKNGIYGIFDLFGAGSETCTEFFCGNGTSTYRGGLSRGLNLIASTEEEKQNLTASFPLGHRNFTVPDAQWINHGYRIMLLPQNI